MTQTEENGWLRSFIALSIIVLTAVPGLAAQSNVISIGDVVMGTGNNTTIPIMIYDATDVAAVGLNLRYDPDVVNVTGAEQGDFTFWFVFDDSNAADGWVTINTFVMGGDLSGDLIIANVTLESAGSPGDSSQLNLENIVLANQSGYTKEFVADNGTFSIHGVVTAADAIIALRMAVGTVPAIDEADIDRDGRVTSLDALMILQAAAGRI